MQILLVKQKSLKFFDWFAANISIFLQNRELHTVGLMQFKKVLLAKFTLKKIPHSLFKVFIENASFLIL